MKEYKEYEFVVESTDTQHFWFHAKSEEEAEDLRHGRSINREVKPDTIAWSEGLPIAVLIPLKDGSQNSRARKVF